MPLTLQWTDIGLRLAVAVIAAVLIGWDRGEHGEPSGIRTTLIVCLTSTTAMLAANLLLHTTGKANDSFVTLDVMRLPLGILTGMGFIGAGAILKRGETVQGLTTAATLWFVTVIGICCGSGLIGLAIAATILGAAVLSGLKWLGERLPKYRRATITVVIAPDGPPFEEVAKNIKEADVSLRGFSVESETDRRTLVLRVLWHDRSTTPRLPPAITALANLPGVVELRWEG